MVPAEAAKELEHLMRLYARTTLGAAKVARGAKKQRAQHRPQDAQANEAQLKEKIKSAIPNFIGGVKHTRS